MGSEARQLHIFFFPFMAQRHMIPTIDIARLFAARGTKSTIITTPLNALHFTQSIERDKQSGLDIGIVVIPFPSVEAGLSKGCEDQSAISSKEMDMNFFKAVAMLEKPFEQLLEQHRPDCLVAICSYLGQPMLLRNMEFHGSSFMENAISLYVFLKTLSYTLLMKRLHRIQKYSSCLDYQTK
ncbi:hypothetical protein IFM89_035972 [Coptis chinensis]|uniref:Uncharacterized protein n=1 Tax=Coptis chinensis TaxID=261450 RepID=A0A835LGS6_9MAGN|nr:hypothetical protein IFM89_035972 [Coptis chinensis]